MTGNERIAFIGGGHITEILLHNLVGGGVLAPQQVIVGEPLVARRAYLGETFGVETTADNVTAASAARYIFINLRPEVVAAVVPELQAAHLRPNQVVISLAAGTPLSRYDVLGPAQPLVRALPNPPSRIGQGIAALVFTPPVTEEQREAVRNLFRHLGEIVEVDEPSLDIITSLSSPAATYLFFQSLIDAAVRCGLSRTIATQVAARTIAGSLAMWRSRDVSPADLIAEASTPGGISVETLYLLEQHAFKGAIMEAIAAGAARAAALSKG